MVSRPVTVAVIIISILCFGALCLRGLSISLLPNVEHPTLTVRAAWEGAAPELVEQRLAEPLESVLSGVPGLESVASYARSGVALLTLKFSWKQDMDLAFLAVREKLDQARFLLPEEAGRPVLIRANPSDKPVAVLSVGLKSGSNQLADKTKLWRWVDRVFVRRLEQLEGVGQAIIVGAVQPQVQVLIDPDRLLAHGLSLAVVSQRIQEVNMFTAAGELQDGWYRYTVKMEGRFKTLEELGETPIARMGVSKVLLLRDIARFVEAEQPPTSFSLANGIPVLSVLVKPAWGANNVEVFSALQTVLDEVRRQYPEFQIDILEESASVVSASIRQLLQALAIGSILAFLVLFVFLRDPLMPFAIGISIPLSLAATFIVMYLSGIQLNIMSLSGLTLGVGLLVDNAIVVLENIKRFREEGKDRIEAALLGTKEVALPATASTLTTISVFLPLVLLGDAEGSWFREQALTLSYSLLASLGAALFILPPLAVFFSRATIHASPLVNTIQAGYERALGFAFRYWKGTLFLLGLGAAASVFALINLEKTTFPAIDSLISTVEVVLPENSTLERTREAALAFSASIKQIDPLSQTVALGGFTDQTRPEQMAREKLNRFTLRISSSSVALKDAVMAHIGRLKKENPDWKVTLEEQQLFGEMGVAGGDPYVDVQLIGQDRSVLTEYSNALRALLKTRYSDSIQTVFPEKITLLALKPKQELWIQYGFSAAEITMQLEALGLGRLATRWNRQEQSEEIRLFMAKTGESSLGDRKIRLASANWAIKDLFDIKTVQQPEVLTRQYQGKMLSLRIYMGYADFRKKEAALRQDLRAFMENRNLDVRLAGPLIETERLVQRITRLLTFSVILIFLILAMQYESLGYPFLILFSIPFSWMGAVGLVWAMGLSLNVFSMLGVLILTGIAVNDAILKIDFMKRYYQEHGNAKAAAILAGKNRFRPVVMTTLTTILGLIPMLFPFGNAPEITQSLGAALVGGMVSSTVLTLFIIPQFFIGYHYAIDTLNERFWKKRTSS